MRLVRFSIANYRVFRERQVFNLENRTTFVGPNDAGKTAILSAMDIFFNDGKVLPGEVNVGAENRIVRFSAVFRNLPQELVLDASIKTTLSAEELLNLDGELEIIKEYDHTTQKLKITTKILTNSCLLDGKHLMSMKQRDLQKYINDNGLSCADLKINAVMRQAIREQRLKGNDKVSYELLVGSSSDTPDLKDLWEKIKPLMPTYAYFVADRKNTDNEDEIQNPLSFAIKNILSNETPELQKVGSRILESLSCVVQETLEELSSIAPNVAKTLKPEIVTPDWSKAFKATTILSDDNIPLNLRGSGVRRLILLSFFRAEVKRKVKLHSGNVIYAIEEPETSLHPSFQKSIIDSLKYLSDEPNTQIVLTTHSPFILKELELDEIRIVNQGIVSNVPAKNCYVLPYVSLNEISYSVLGTNTTDFHNELYGYIDAMKFKDELFNQQKKSGLVRKYVRMKNNTPTSPDNNYPLCRFVRDRIHHPENKFADELCDDDIEESIRCMLDFIKSKRKLSCDANPIRDNDL